MSYSYPQIPQSMLDWDGGLDKELSAVQYGVSSINKKSTEWGTPEERASQEEHVSPENEQLIRTYHPALSNQPYVSVKKDANGKLIWVVWETNNTTIAPTHIAGRELHIVPRFRRCWSDRAILPDPIARRINPRGCLLREDLDAIREKFPSAIGIRILISGFAVLVYHNVDDIHADWNGGVPGSLGGLFVGYMIKTLNPSVANKQDAGYYLAALEHMAGKPLARFQLPEEYSKLSDINIANEWAPYKDALDGEPVVTASIKTDHTPKKVQKAVVEGVEYHWDHQFRSSSSSASLLWRTSHEPLPSIVCAQSSSILCLGKPGEANVRPVVFQNYDFPIGKWPLRGDKRRSKPTGSIKAGFFLPTDVRNAETVLELAERLKTLWFYCIARGLLASTNS